MKTIVNNLSCFHYSQYYPVKNALSFRKANFTTIRSKRSVSTVKSYKNALTASKLLRIVWLYFV